MITGAVVLDHWGVVKADVGIRDGRIVALGKAGNPDTMDGVHPALVIGPGTEIIAGNGRILTAGAIDSHVHLICPSILEEALARRHHHDDRRRHRAGRGHQGHHGHARARGTWPACSRRWTRGRSTCCCSARATPSPKSRCGSSCGPAPAASSCTRTGAPRPPRSTPACGSATRPGVQAAIHTDTLNEAGFVEETLRAIGGRGIHAYHTEGAGGGHAPDIITVAGAPERAAVVDQPDPPVHPQHARRAPRHADGLPPPEPDGAGGPGVRGEPHPPVDDGGRGPAARPGRDLDDRLRLAGDGPGRRGGPAHVADRARHEGAARRRCRATARPTTCGPGATSRSTRSARR